MPKRIAVIGSGVSGLVAAYSLHEHGYEVHLYEKGDRLGGHAQTVTVGKHEVDVGFQVLNHCTYPNLLGLFDKLGVELEASDMSFAVDVPNLVEWGSDSLQSVFAQKKNSLRPSFWYMLYDMKRIYTDVMTFLQSAKSDEAGARLLTLGDFLTARKYSDMFIHGYMVPMCASIWSTAANEVLAFPAFSILTFMKNHHLLQLTGRPQWLTVKGRSRAYVERIADGFRHNVKLNSPVTKVEPVRLLNEPRVRVYSGESSFEDYDAVVMATHAPDTIEILGKSITPDEKRLLSAFAYKSNDIYLHSDAALLPRNRAIWSSWNFMGSTDKKVYCSYYENRLQNIPESDGLVVVTLNPTRPPAAELTIARWEASHPIPTVASYEAQCAMDSIQGTRGIYFAGAYAGWGFHEDGAKSGFHAASLISGSQWQPLACLPAFSSSMSWAQTGARTLVTKYFSDFVVEGELELRERGGKIYQFGKPMPGLSKVVVEVLDPTFYTSLSRRSDLGFADAVIDGHVKTNLYDFFMLAIHNRDSLGGFKSNLSSKLGTWQAWWSHRSRANTQNNTRKNISAHYDLSNAMFELFLDPTMTYSSAYFATPEQPLEEAQKNKIEMLYRKAQVKPGQRVLEIGSGWGALAIHLAKTRGCHVVGLTLSEEQKQLAEERVLQAGLEQLISFELIDYRSYADTYKGQKFDRIISCEMLEAVGAEFFDDFFRSMEKVLAPEGVVALQTISLPDQRWQQYLSGVDFIQERIFPGGCLTCLSALTASMTRSSKFILADVHEFGPHYAHTLKLWREQFHRNTVKLDRLGFDITFRRTWDYYFEYCRAGFASNTLQLYQLVLTRPNNTSAFSLTKNCRNENIKQGS